MIPASGINSVRDLVDCMAASGRDGAFLISPETGCVVSFSGLRRQALQLSHRFARLGLQQGDKVAFLMDNGLFTAQLLLGTMYGGFVSVPLNVRAGASQLSYALGHCDARIVVAQPKYSALINDVTADAGRPITVIWADHDRGPNECEPADEADNLPAIGAADPALLMYTSGSTGQPKGAIHTHGSILAHGRNSVAAHRLTAADRSLLVLPLYHINAECVTLVPALSSGGSVVIPHQFVVSEFWNWLDDWRCTWSAVVPTIISQLLDWKDPKSASRREAFARIRFMRSSSAPLSAALHREFLDKFAVPLIQAMGSSEAGNVFANPVPPGVNKIGSPGLAWGYETRIVNADGAEMPAGEPGEVLLRGDGLAQGYYKDQAGTLAAFDAAGWLHTGDLAYRDADGYFFVVGRAKELIIKGGMNIAPRQIDEILEAHPAVLEAAVVGVPDRYFGEDLVAFAVLRDAMQCDERELIRFCESRLGHFKTPTRIYVVADLPKGPSGKVQRLQLVEVAQRRATATPAPSALNSAADLPVEQIITGIWTQLLGQNDIGPHDNFFALGGQSLLAIQCLSRLRDRIAVILSLSDFFENATVAQQAALVRRLLANAASQNQAGATASLAAEQPIPMRQPGDPCLLSLAQLPLWFIEQLNDGVPAYNEAEAVRLRGRLDIAALQLAFNGVVARHDILRSTIAVTNGEPAAVVHAQWNVTFKRIDLRHLEAASREAELARLLTEEPRLAYDLAAEPGIRGAVIALEDDEHVFILMMHHLTCDSSSLGIFWRELSALYGTFTQQQRTACLPELPIQYGDYAVWQRQPSQQARFASDLAFWQENLRGAPMIIDLPADRKRPAVVSYRGRKQQFHFGAAFTNDLRALCRQERVSLFTVFAATLNTLLYRYTGQDDILIGVPVADRDRPELQHLIGFLLATHVLRTDLSGNPPFRDLLARVQQSVACIHSHRSVPFDQVVALLHPDRKLSYAPVFQVMLNWRDSNDRPHFIGLPGLSCAAALAHAGTSKFDLTLEATDCGEEIHLAVEYSTDLFDAARIDRLVGHLCTLMQSAIKNTELPLSELSLLTAAERRQLLLEWNAQVDEVY